MSSVPQNRRQFLTTAGGLVLGGATLYGVEPFNRRGNPHLRLSCAAYSFRDDFSAPKGAPEGTKPRMDMYRFIDFCADNGCDGAELTSYYFPKDYSNDDFAKVRRHAHLRGISVSGTAVGNNFTLPPGQERNEDLASVKK